MAGGEGRALCEVMKVEVTALGDGAPLSVQEGERREGIGFGGREDPGKLDVVSGWLVTWGGREVTRDGPPSTRVTVEGTAGLTAQ